MAGGARVGAGRKNTITDEMVERMREMFLAGKSLAEVAHATGLARGTVSGRFDRVAIGNLYIEGIERRRKQSKLSETVDV